MLGWTLLLIQTTALQLFNSSLNANSIFYYLAMGKYLIEINKTNINNS